MLKIIAVNSNLHDLLQYKSIGKIPELSDVSQNLISVCEKILQTLHLIYQHQDNNDYFVEMTIFNIRKLIRWKSPLPASFINKYSSADLFHKFMTGFYRMYFSKCFIKSKYAKHYHLYIDFVYQQAILEVWLKKYIPMLKMLEESVSRFLRPRIQLAPGSAPG